MPLLLDPGKEVVRDCREVKASLLRTLRIVDELGGAVLFGHEFVAKLEHVRAPFFAKIILGWQVVSCLFRLTSQSVAEMKVPRGTSGPRTTCLAPAAGDCQRAQPRRCQ